jgi:hypothetical protein
VFSLLLLVVVRLLDYRRSCGMQVLTLDTAHHLVRTKDLTERNLCVRATGKGDEACHWFIDQYVESR